MQKISFLLLKNNAKNTASAHLWAASPIYLVALHPPDLEDPAGRGDQLEPVLPEEHGAPVGPVVVGQVDARRVGFRHEPKIVR